MVQIFVKMDGGRTSTTEMAPSDKVNDIVKRIPTSACCNQCDVYVRAKGKCSKRSEELRSCGVSDGCIVQVNRMRGGGKHRNKHNKAEKKTAASQKDAEPERGPQEHEEEKVFQSLLSRENAEDEVVRHFEETEGSRKIFAHLAEGSNSDMEQWIQLYTEMTRLNDEHKKTIRRAVEARRRDTGREPTTEHEQGEKARLMEEERRAQEARAWQGQLMEKNEGEHKNKRENRKRKGARKMTRSGFQWCLTWRQVAHTSRPLTRKMWL